MGRREKLVPIRLIEAATDAGLKIKGRYAGPRGGPYLGSLTAHEAIREGRALAGNPPDQDPGLPMLGAPQPDPFAPEEQ